MDQREEEIYGLEEGRDIGTEGGILIVLII